MSEAEWRSDVNRSLMLFTGAKRRPNYQFRQSPGVFERKPLARSNRLDHRASVSVVGVNALAGFELHTKRKALLILDVRQVSAAREIESVAGVASLG